MTPPFPAPLVGALDTLLLPCCSTLSDRLAESTPSALRAESTVPRGVDCVDSAGDDAVEAAPNPIECRDGVFRASLLGVESSLLPLAWGVGILLGVESSLPRLGIEEEAVDAEVGREVGGELTLGRGALVEREGRGRVPLTVDADVPLDADGAGANAAPLDADADVPLDVGVEAAEAACDPAAARERAADRLLAIPLPPPPPLLLLNRESD